MPRSTKSAASSRRSRPKHSTLGRRLIVGLKEALAHSRGEINLPSYTVEVPEDVDVVAVRRGLGLSQAAFARTFGLDVTAIHAWEQGRRRPDRAARVLLAVIAKEPQAVLKALARQAGGTRRSTMLSSRATARSAGDPGPIDHQTLAVIHGSQLARRHSASRTREKRA